MARVRQTPEAGGKRNRTLTEIVQGQALAEWLWGRQRLDWIRRVVAQLHRFPTLADLHNSSFWRADGEALQHFLTTIQAGGPGGDRSIFGEDLSQEIPDSGFPESRPLRIVHWNILKGISFEGIVQALAEHPALREPDVLLLNEVDVGMARSANRHVAAELAERLGLYWTFVPSYLELTKGPGTDQAASGQNEIGLHGVAVLSREPPVEVLSVPLPEVFDYFGFSEKRYGTRTALLLRMPAGLVVGTAHLEVRSTPARRADQVQALLNAIANLRSTAEQAGYSVRRILLSGDLNTHTFPRGHFTHSLRGFLRLLTTPRPLLRRQLMEPWRGMREPLFDLLRQEGYAWGHLNDQCHTAWAPLETIEEGSVLPGALRDLLRRILHPDPRGIPLRLDWFVGWGGISLSGPNAARTVQDLFGAKAPSDHAPLVLNI